MQKAHAGVSAASTLHVRLDGTLVRTNLLIETVFALLKTNVFYILLFPIWLARGFQFFKENVALRVDLDPAALPYDDRLVEQIRSAHRSGRAFVLTASVSERHLRVVTEHLGLAAAPGRPYEARASARLRTSPSEGARPEPSMTSIWEAEPGEATYVGAAPSRPEGGGRVAQIALYAKALRVHQWLKNLLVFVPLVLAHRVLELEGVLQAGAAFVSFCLCASGIYVLNDLVDLAADRRHPTKRFRPFAAGTLPVAKGALMIPALLAGALGVALLLPPQFSLLLWTYILVNLLYCFYLKRLVLFDVLTLASLYTLRIIAGAAAIVEPLSFWLLAFSVFLFASLALAKRYVEIAAVGDRVGRKGMGRGYRAVDLETLAHFGICSAFMAVLVLALYINSQEIRELYTRPEVIWFLCPLLLYLVCRVWLLARRGELHDDPVVFAARDRRSQAMVALGLLLLVAAAQW
jgi:4-hydroxybenzoate polyprenyltransferase